MAYAPKSLAVRPAHVSRRDYDALRDDLRETRALYRTPRWRRLRAMQLAAQPLCAECQRSGRVTPATTVHHVTPHRDDVARFWAGPFESVCAPCHSGVIQRREAAGG